MKDVYNTAEFPMPATDSDNWAWMTFTVDNPADKGASGFPDTQADPLTDPYLREIRMLYVGGNLYRGSITVPAGVDLKGRRLSIETDEGGAYNVFIQ